MLATRQLREFTLPKEDGKDIVEDVINSEKFIDALQSAIERLTTAVKVTWKTSAESTVTQPTISDIYADFVSEWYCSPTLDPSLVSLNLDDLIPA